MSTVKPARSNGSIPDTSKVAFLINNAGTFDCQCRFTHDGIESHFEVNALSQYIFSTVLKPLLLKSKQGRIINLSGLSHKAGKFNLKYIQDRNESSKSVLNTISLCSDSCLYRNLLTFKIAKEMNYRGILCRWSIEITPSAIPTSGVRGFVRVYKQAETRLLEEVGFP